VPPSSSDLRAGRVWQAGRHDPNSLQRLPLTADRTVI
jgi:hypothetical protein